ncbi:hypothetical protein [Deinococcus roseus]|uniref:Polymer-forming cytoskeletal protein n=1 Tax=Deinococcus roseus TaxID=392414 RepID=A0ABQ2D4R6_9DEIO|nr:hypothetical protein [Deinococcus roseus]GGJ45578.1 hypothetical protein GCM10008938_34890 [Deinococcus roseus]
MDKPLNSNEEHLQNALDFGRPPPEGFFARFKEIFEVEEALDHLPVLQIPDWLSEFMQEHIHDHIFRNTLDLHPLLDSIERFTQQYLPPTFALPEPIMEDHETQQVLSQLSALKAPPGFAAQVIQRIQDDHLQQDLQQLKVKAPEGFAAQVIQRIQDDRLHQNLQQLKVKAPEGFASHVVQRIQDDHLRQELQALKLKTPEGFTAQLVQRIQEDQLHQDLQQLKVKAPEGFAAQVAACIQEDHLREELQQLKVKAPEGFADRILQHMQNSSELEMQSALQNLPALKVPEGFTAQLVQRIQDDHLGDQLKSLTVKAPEGFSDSVLQHMQERSTTEVQAALQGLPALKVPEGFAAHVASRIARDAQAQETHNPAPLYLVGMALLAAAFALFSFVFPNMQVGVNVLADLARNISGLALGVMGGLALVSVFALFSRIKFAPQITYAAFAVAMLMVYPNIQQAFGPATIAPREQVSNVVRVGGDVVVRGHVTGDVLALGGNIKLIQGSQVDGRIVTLLGDVTKDPGVQASVPTAILGRVNGELPIQNTVLPSVGVASAFVPLLNLMKNEYWPAFYFAFLCVFTLLVYQSGHGSTLVRQAFREPNRNLALGYVAFLVALPVLLISTLVGNAVLLGLGIVLLVALTAGLSISLLMLGATFTRRLHGQSHPATFAIIGLGLYLVLLSFPAAASVLWFAGGCYGLGVLLNYIRKTNVTHLKSA